MGLKENIKQKRLENSMTLEDLANKVGVSRQTIQRYESGIISNIPSDKIELMAEALNTTPADLMGWTVQQAETLSSAEYSLNPALKESVMVSINVLGRVAAGIPIEAVQDIIDTEDISVEMAKTGEFFGLQIHGDSMEPRICEGDVVIVRKQDNAESGDIVIAMINGDDATCKRLRKYRDGIELISNNPSYTPMFFSNNDIIEKPVKIIGKVVELRAKF